MTLVPESFGALIWSQNPLVLWFCQNTSFSSSPSHLLSHMGNFLSGFPLLKLNFFVVGEFRSWGRISGRNLALASWSKKKKYGILSYSSRGLHNIANQKILKDYTSKRRAVYIHWHMCAYLDWTAMTFLMWLAPYSSSPGEPASVVQRPFSPPLVMLRCLWTFIFHLLLFVVILYMTATDKLRENDRGSYLNEKC